MQSECDLHHKHGVTSFTVRDRELCHYAETVKAMLTIPSSLTAQTSAEVGCEVSASRSKLSLPQKERRRALIVPREHGAWGMLLIPLLTGGAVGHFEGGRVLPVLLLTLAVLALFWLRTPLESLLGTGAIPVQTIEERQAVRAVILPLATIVAVFWTILFWQKNYPDLIWLRVITGAALGLQIFLKKAGGQPGWRRK
ncbi:MAG: YwiC-like family protein [Candidatus Sulfotelmatobacter sp.]